MVEIISQQAPLSWQKDNWQRLTLQHQRHRLPHALLLGGGRGMGKALFAEAFASYILCSEPLSGKACTKCKSCQLLNAHSHPNLILLEPDEKSSVIKVDQIRKLKSFTSQTAQISDYKVIIVRPCDRLNINAANALLKDLEEPSVKTLFMLISDQPGQIVATVRSRCQDVLFLKPDKEQATKWLTNKLPDENADTIELLLTFANNAPLQALQLHGEGSLKCRKNIYRGFSQVQQGKGHPVSVAGLLQEHEVLDIIYWLQIWTLDIIKTVQTNNKNFVKNKDLADFLIKCSLQAKVNELYFYLDELQVQRQAALSGHNPNKTLLLESLLIKWAQCFKS